MILHEQNSILRQKIFDGVRKIAELVTITLGPKGNTVIVSLKDQKPISTKDGYNVSKFFQLDDTFENLGAQIAKEVSQKSADLAGDGSSTVLVLLNAILQQAQRYLVAGSFPIDLKYGMEKMSKHIIEQVMKESKQIKSKQDIFNIASISANNDASIGQLVSEAFDCIGKDGALLIEDSKNFETVLKIVEGFTFDTGYLASQFITNERKLSVNYNDPFYLITDHRIDTIQDMLPVLEIVARDGRPLIIVAEDLAGQALAAIVANSVNGTLKIAAVKPPRYGQERRNIMSDLALATGATFITRESGMRLKDIKLSHLGSSKTIEVLKNFTTIVDGKGNQEKIKERIEDLKEEIKQTDDLAECKRIQERITRLASGIAIIYVGGSTEIEAIEKRHRIEDSVEASKSAIEQGISAGGGVTLMKIALSEETDTFIKDNAKNEDEKFGMMILRKAIREPFSKIISNAGLSGEVIATKCDFANGIGYDVANDKCVNMMESGIIDPTKVICCALTHSVSVAISIIMSKAAIVEI